MENKTIFNEVRIVGYDGEILAKTDDVDWFIEVYEKNKHLCAGVIIQLYTGFRISDEPWYILRKEWRF